jgi:hypothetical protein
MADFGRYPPLTIAALAERCADRTVAAPIDFMGNHGSRVLA